MIDIDADIYKRETEIEQIEDDLAPTRTKHSKSIEPPRQYGDGQTKFKIITRKDLQEEMEGAKRTNMTPDDQMLLQNNYQMDYKSKSHSIQNVSLHN